MDLLVAVVVLAVQVVLMTALELKLEAVVVLVEVFHAATDLILEAIVPTAVLLHHHPPQAAAVAAVAVVAVAALLLIAVLQERE